MTQPDTAAPPTRRATTRPRTIRVSDGQWDAAVAYATAHDTTVSQLIRDHFAAITRRHNPEGTTP